MDEFYSFNQWLLLKWIYKIFQMGICILQCKSSPMLNLTVLYLWILTDWSFFVGIKGEYDDSSTLKIISCRIDNGDDFLLKWLLPSVQWCLNAIVCFFAQWGFFYSAWRKKKLIVFLYQNINWWKLLQDKISLSFVADDNIHLTRYNF